MTGLANRRDILIGLAGFCVSVLLPGGAKAYSERAQKLTALEFSDLLMKIDLDYRHATIEIVDGWLVSQTEREFFT